MTEQFSQNSNFCLEAQILSWTKITANCFLWNDRQEDEFYCWEFLKQLLGRWQPTMGLICTKDTRQQWHVRASIGHWASGVTGARRDPRTAFPLWEWLGPLPWLCKAHCSKGCTHCFLCRKVLHKLCFSVSEVVIWKLVTNISGAIKPIFCATR